jgi:hypothetical protein
MYAQRRGKLQEIIIFFGWIEKWWSWRKRFFSLNLNKLFYKKFLLINIPLFILCNWKRVRVFEESVMLLLQIYLLFGCTPSNRFIQSNSDMANPSLFLSSVYRLDLLIIHKNIYNPPKFLFHLNFNKPLQLSFMLFFLALHW